MNRGLFLLVLSALLPAPLRGAEVTRVLKTIDFEERSLGNDELLPMHWTKLQGPGLPHYVNGELATDRHRSGDYSFRFDLNGGSLIYRYQPGLIQVQHGAHYRVNAFCQTTTLAHARARMTAYLVDIDGHPLPDSFRHSMLYAAASDQEEWKRLSVEVTAASPAASSLAIELELLQPELYAVPKAGQKPLFEQDIHGSVWWDDITVSQVPQISLRTQRPGNVFARRDPVRLAVRVSDRSTEDLIVQLSVRDADGREVYQRTGKPQVHRLEDFDSTQGQMLLELPSLSPGWYEAKLVISGAGRTLGTQSQSFVVLADAIASAPPDGRFGFVATALPFEAWEQLPQVLPMLSAGRVKLAVWNGTADVEQNNGTQFDRLLKSLSDIGIVPTACLAQLPPRIVQKIGSSDWRKLLNAPANTWQPDLDFLISRHANHLDRWQLGADGSDAFVRDPAMREVYRRVLKQFSQLIDKPDLAMPWPAWYELSGELPATIALDVPPSILPEQLPLYIREIRGQSNHNLSVNLELLGKSQYGREAEIADLAERVIYAVAAGTARIELPLPFDASQDQDGVVLEPRETLLVMRTLVSTLSGAQYKGKVSLGDGIEAFLFDRDGKGILALWSRGDASARTELSLNLGDRPARVDLWGNVTPLPRPAGERRGRVSLALDSMPVFLIDIDGPQAQLRASLAIDRSMIESSFHPHTRRVRFTNPYPQAIAGTLHFRGPSGWTLNPPTFNFGLNPGETFDREITLQFPYNSVAGVKTLLCDVFIEGQKNSPFVVPLSLKLGLSDVGMQTLALRDGNDIFVQQTVTNYGDEPINYNAFAVCHPQARQERLVTNLAPGATTVRRYRFPNLPRNAEIKVLVGLKEVSGTRILNDEVRVR